MLKKWKGIRIRDINKVLPGGKALKLLFWLVFWEAFLAIILISKGVCLITNIIIAGINMISGGVRSGAKVIAKGSKKLTGSLAKIFRIK